MEVKVYSYKKPRKMADGSIREYICTETRSLKGGSLCKDGVRRIRDHLGEEVKAEIREKFSLGVSKKRLMEDYHCNQKYLAEILDGKK